MDVQSRVSNVCGRLLKPSEAEAKELGKLFGSGPSSSGSTSVPSFNPKQPLAGLPDKKKKKKASSSSGRTVNVSVCRLQKFTPFIPKGKVRKTLKSQGRIHTIQLTRSMLPSAVKQSITRAFKNFGTGWVYLETGQDNKLTVMERQSLDGNDVCSRRGCLYILDREIAEVNHTVYMAIF